MNEDTKPLFDWFTIATEAEADLDRQVTEAAILTTVAHFGESANRLLQRSPCLALKLRDRVWSRRDFEALAAAHPADRGPSIAVDRRALGCDLATPRPRLAPHTDPQKGRQKCHAKTSRQRTRRVPQRRRTSRPGCCMISRTASGIWSR